MLDFWRGEHFVTFAGLVCLFDFFCKRSHCPFGVRFDRSPSEGSLLDHYVKQRDCGIGCREDSGKDEWIMCMTSVYPWRHMFVFDMHWHWYHTMRLYIDAEYTIISISIYIYSNYIYILFIYLFCSKRGEEKEDSAYLVLDTETCLIDSVHICQVGELMFDVQLHAWWRREKQSSQCLQIARVDPKLTQSGNRMKVAMSRQTKVACDRLRSHQVLQFSLHVFHSERTWLPCSMVYTSESTWESCLYKFGWTRIDKTWYLHCLGQLWRVPTSFDPISSG